MISSYFAIYIVQVTFPYEEMNYFSCNILLKENGNAGIAIGLTNQLDLPINWSKFKIYPKT